MLLLQVNFSYQQKNNQAMAELEVMIPMGQYKTLKDFESKLKKNEAKLKQCEGKLWKTEQQLKFKHQEASQYSVKVKELSLNAIKLAKKVMISQDLLSHQEQRWLKREKDLLEKMIEAVKAKEHFQVQLKMGKEILKVKEQKLKETGKKIDHLQSQLNVCQKQKESIQFMYQKTVKQMKGLSLKNQEIRREYEQKIVKLQDSWNQELQINKIQAEKLAEKNTLLKQAIQRMNLEIKKEQEQNFNVLKRWHQNMDVERQKHQNSLNKKDQELIQLQNKYNLTQRKAWLNLQKLSQGVLQISRELQTTFQLIAKQKKQTQRLLENFQIEANKKIQNVISQKHNHLQLLEKRLESLKNSTSIQIQRCQEQSNKQKKSSEAQIGSLRKKVSQMEQTKHQMSKLTKINQQINSMKNQLQKQLIQSQGCVAELQKTVSQHTRQIKTLQSEKQALNKSLNDLHHQKEAEKQYQCRQLNFQNQFAGVDTQALQIGHQAISGQKRSQNYKEALNKLWAPISEYLKAMKGRILEDQALRDFQKQILAEQLKLILNRFLYLFDKGIQQQMNKNWHL